METNSEKYCYICSDPNWSLTDEAIARITPLSEGTHLCADCTEIVERYENRTEHEKRDRFFPPKMKLIRELWERKVKVQDIKLEKLDKWNCPSCGGSVGGFFSINETTFPVHCLRCWVIRGRNLDPPCLICSNTDQCLSDECLDRVIGLKKGDNLCSDCRNDVTEYVNKGARESDFIRSFEHPKILLAERLWIRKVKANAIQLQSLDKSVCTACGGSNDEGFQGPYTLRCCKRCKQVNGDTPDWKTKFFPMY